MVSVFGSGPQAVDLGITWSSTNASTLGGSAFGYTGGYSFFANGSWSGIDMAGLNDSFDVSSVTDTMTFAFSSPVAAVGGFLNYVPGASTPTRIAIYNSSMALIESHNLTFLTGGGANTGRFLGFQQPTPDISFFTLTDNYIGITNLTTRAMVPAVPEPAMALPLLGLLGILGFMRRVK